MRHVAGSPAQPHAQSASGRFQCSTVGKYHVMSQGIVTDSPAARRAFAQIVAVPPPPSPAGREFISENASQSVWPVWSHGCEIGFGHDAATSTSCHIAASAIEPNFGESSGSSALANLTPQSPSSQSGSLTRPCGVLSSPIALARLPKTRTSTGALVTFRTV